jgi:hypothetical protein
MEASPFTQQVDFISKIGDEADRPDLESIFSFG